MKFVGLLLLILAHCNTTQAILKGRTANILDFPYIGSYQVATNAAPNGWRFCTALIVQQNVAITAGQCVLVDRRKTKERRLMPLDVYYPRLIMGVTNYTDSRSGAFQRREMVELYIHPEAEYGLGEPVSSRYDIGAMRWLDPILLNDLYTTITHWVPPFDPENSDFPRDEIIELLIAQETTCEIPGWGETSFDRFGQTNVPFSEILYKVEYQLKRRENFCSLFPGKQNYTCFSRLGEHSGYNPAVRTDSGKVVSWGDTGGPIVCPYRGRRFAVGILVSGMLNEENLFSYGLWSKDANLRKFLQGIQALPMSHSQRKTSGFGLFLSILLTTFSLAKVH